MRFYLLYNRPEKSDSNFNWNQFLEDINNNFIDNIGNLLNRVLVFFQRHFKGELSSVSFSKTQRSFLQEIKEIENESSQEFQLAAYYAVSQPFNKKINIHDEGATLGFTSLLSHVEKSEYIRKFDPQISE